MFDNNGHQPILTEMEIRFLLSDQPVSASHTPHPDHDDKKGTARKTEKKTIVDNLHATSREPG